ncbi:MAG: hypothetical protein R2729_24145 [Bryobacteraceae bacterium]
MSGLATEGDAQRAAAAISEVLELAPSRQPVPNEPAGTRVIVYVVAILASPLAARIAGFVEALFSGGI